jgi:hypothetical protein
MIRGVNTLQQHEISESSHRILNAFTDEKLMLLGEICRLRPGQQQLDLASGKGEMLCRWAQHFGTGGLGVDISDVFVPAAKARAAELGVDDRVRFEHADASTFVAEPATYDVVSCIGATWIGDGVGGTIDLMRPALRPGGLLLVGEPFWQDGRPDEAVDVLGRASDDFTSLVGTLDRFEAAGTELVEMVLSDGDSWDRYAASQWWNVREWLLANPAHPDAAEMRDYLERARRKHLQWQRRWLGWGVFVLRDR